MLLIEWESLITVLRDEIILILLHDLELKIERERT